MEKNGLELLKTLKEASDALIKLLHRENIPPIFSLFLKHYKVGEDFLATKYIKHKNTERVLEKFIMFENEIIEGEEYYATIDYLFDYEKLLDEFDKYDDRIENWNREGFVQIGLMYWGDVLLLGVGNNNKDEIWRYGNGLINTHICKLDNNIFDFFSRLKSLLDLETLDELEIKDPSQLYRNWGDNFWRVREE